MTNKLLKTACRINNKIDKKFDNFETRGEKILIKWNNGIIKIILYIQNILNKIIKLKIVDIIVLILSYIFIGILLLMWNILIPILMIIDINNSNGIITTLSFTTLSLLFLLLIQLSMYYVEIRLIILIFKDYCIKRLKEKID